MLPNIVRGLQFADLRVNRVLAVAVGVLTLCTMFLVTISIGGRYLLGKPVPSTIEISEVILVLVIFLPLAYVQQRGGHLRVMFLYSRLPKSLRTACDILALALSTMLFALMTWQTLIYALHSWASSETSWGIVPIPLWIPKFGIFFGCLVFSLHTFGSLFMRVKELVRGAP
ncbi:MAG: TRAP transporter small permease [Pseudomonadota bacterium]